MFLFVVILRFRSDFLVKFDVIELGLLMYFLLIIVNKFCFEFLLKSFLGFLVLG